MLRHALYTFVTATLLAGAATTAAYAVDDFRNPEITRHNAVPLENRASVKGKRYMITAANPLATQVGADILARGGNAVDAAIATQLALNVVEPQSSGIGGGGFMLYYDAATKKLHIYDGRETAPMEASSTLFLDANGKPLPFMQAVQGGHSVGTPGLLKMLETAHRKHGHTEWSQLFQGAMTLSGQGFPMSPRLHDLLTTTAHVQAFPASMRPFLNAEGNVKAEGEIVINKPLHDTFATLAIKGTKPFYEGAIAADIAKAVETSPIHPGTLSLNDLKKYQVREREPVCAPYREYRVCSMPPPSSGGVTILQALRILEKLQGMDIREAKPVSADAVHLFAEASKLAYADRNRYLADPDFVDVPVAELLDDDYLASRAALIAPDHALKDVKHGTFGEAEQKAAFILTTEEHPSTTHLSVVDMQGNAVSMTTSIEQGFGSGLSVDGFLLNNQLTDFSFLPNLPDGTPHPNRVEPGKRPRSSMSPSMVFDKDGKLVMVIGSPGGARIIEYTLQTLIGVLDWDLDIQQAINLPHYLNMNGPTELEANTPAAELKDELEARGHVVKVIDSPSGLHGVVRVGSTLKGGADPRREGVAIGE
jgi:gamma-glutamyltranspeptidase / glutathione hydrolase